LFAKKIGRKLIDEGVADWNGRKLVDAQLKKNCNKNEV
jgi:hypothetical protein